MAQDARAPEPLVIVDVRLSADAEAPRVGLVLRKGRIERVLEEGAELPANLRVIEGAGALALPAFIDAYTTRGCETPPPVADQDRPSSVNANVHIGMREANRKGLHPSFRALEVFALEDKDLEAYRAQGFAAVHTCPSGELLSGSSAVVTLREAALRDRVLAPEVFLLAAFRASGRGYPSTLMGYLAQLRQFVLDARWQQERLERYAAGKLDRRPPYDRELDAVLPLLRGERRLLCLANNARDIRRWLKFADEQGLKIAICGGAEAWKVATELVEAEVPVLLDLDWGKEVQDPDAEQAKEGEDEAEVPEGAEPVEEDPESAEGNPEDAPSEELAEKPSEEYEEPLGVRRERRRRWAQARDCALRLHAAGVVFAFGSADSSPKELAENVRALVEAGLPEDVATRALTEVAAALLGIDEHTGKLEAGFDANIALWSASPFQKKAHLDWLFVDGAEHKYELDDAESGKPGEGIDLTGTWSVTYDGQEGPPATLELVMDEEGVVTGTLSFTAPDGGDVKTAISGTVTKADFKLDAKIDFSGFSAEMRIEGAIDGDSISGDATWKYSGGEETDSFQGTRDPQPEGEVN